MAAPFGSVLTIEVLGGEGQSGVGGWALEEDVVVRVVNSSGSPAVGRPVTFAAGSGAGSVSASLVNSSVDGRATTRWTVGSSVNRTQRLTASTGGAAPVTLVATVLDDDDVDLLVVHGALGPLKGAVLVDFVAPPRILAARPSRDTLIPLPPSVRAGRDLLILGLGNRPLRVAPTLTDAIDTVHATLLPPVAVDIEFDVQHGEYPMRVVALGAVLDTARAIWAEAGLGVALGERTFVDHTALAPVAVTTTEDCFGGPPPLDQIQVRMVSTIDGGRYVGYACGHVVFIFPGVETHPYLLAHELGHTFGLGHHEGLGVMTPGSSSRLFHDGEVLQAHFSQSSMLNVLFHAQPSDQQVDCFPFPGGCFPPLFDLSSP